MQIIADREFDKIKKSILISSGGRERKFCTRNPGEIARPSQYNCWEFTSHYTKMLSLLVTGKIPKVAISRKRSNRLFSANLIPNYIIVPTESQSSRTNQFLPAHRKGKLQSTPSTINEKCSLSNLSSKMRIDDSR